MGDPVTPITSISMEEALRTPIDSLEQFFEQNPEKKKDVSFWQKKSVADVGLAVSRWPILYKFNTTEENIIYFYDRFHKHGSSPYVAYLQTLFAFDVYIAQNSMFFGPEHTTAWHFRRHLPYWGDATYHYILTEDNVSLDLFTQCYDYDADNNDYLLIQLLRGSKPEQLGTIIARIVNGMYKDLNFNQPRPMANVLDNTETIQFIKSRLLEEVRKMIQRQLEYAQELADHPEKVKPIWNEEKQEYVYPELEMNMPLDKLGYNFFRFDINPPNTPINCYSLLWRLKQNNLPKKKKKIQIPDLKPIWEDAEGLEELAYYLSKQDNTSTFARILTGFRDPREAEESEASTTILCYEMLMHVLPGSALFDLVLETLGDRPSRNFPGSFQTLYAAYEKKKVLFFIEAESKMDTLMQAFYPDFTYFDGNESDDDDNESQCSHPECHEEDEAE